MGTYENTVHSTYNDCNANGIVYVLCWLLYSVCLYILQQPCSDQHAVHTVNLADTPATAASLIQLVSKKLQ